MYPTAEFDLGRCGPPALRAFINISKLWRLTKSEQMVVLGVHDHSIFDDWIVRARLHQSINIPMPVIERISCILSIHASLVTLLSEERTGDWLRASNASPIFGGCSALERIMNGNFDDLLTVARYLLGEIHG